MSLLIGSSVTQSQRTCVWLRSRVRNSSSWMCGRWRFWKTRSWSVALWSPARASQVVMVACRWPKTRTAAATSSPSASAVSTSITRWDAVLRRYSGVTQSVPATRSEGGAAGLTAQGLDALVLPVNAITNQGMHLHVGDLVVVTPAVRTSKALRVDAFGRPRRLFRSGQGALGHMWECWQLRSLHARDTPGNQVGCAASAAAGLGP